VFEVFLDTMPAEWTAAEVEGIERRLPRPAYRRVLDICSGPGRHAQHLIDKGYDVTGVDRDATAIRQARATIPGATFIELDLYCFRVAGTVGLMLAPVLGYSRPRALRAAADLGRAMQLTNILRDVREDLGRGRVYLPQDELAAFGVSEDDLARGNPSGRMRRLFEWQIARARHWYARGRAGIRLLHGARSRLTVRLMATLYADILRAIEERDYDVFHGRVVVPGGRRLALVARCLAGRGA